MHEGTEDGVIVVYSPALDLARIFVNDLVPTSGRALIARARVRNDCIDKVAYGVDFRGGRVGDV